MLFRNYDPERDRDAVYRILFEVGWVEKGEEAKEAALRFAECGRGLVAEVDGAAECSVTSAPGAIRYLETDLAMSGVMGVATSHIGRKKGLASRLTARLVAADALDGTLVSSLSMFDQGFYNQLGFGTGSYRHTFAFNPSHLRIQGKARTPRRLGKEDWEAIHACRLNHLRLHGNCILFPAEVTRYDLEADACFGFAYYDGPNDTMSHQLILHAQEREDGPYRVAWLSYQNGEQFRELMAFITTFSEQVLVFRMQEPPGVQLQDLLQTPFKNRALTRTSKFEAGHWSGAIWQARICDLSGCLAQTHLIGKPVQFNLQLTDPIEKYLDADAPWRGLSDEYQVTLGPESEAKRGTDASLPTLTASVGAFTRLWLGVRPATSLTITDELSGSPALLRQLDETLRLPTPHLYWDF